MSCASAEEVTDEELVVVSGGRKLLTARAAFGMATADTSEN
ncbi:twitching motility protein PilT [Gandjariella thermophila]|nr:twitching motility protein PilT [Gandjariella thermophila]